MVAVLIMPFVVEMHAFWCLVNFLFSHSLITNHDPFGSCIAINLPTTMNETRKKVIFKDCHYFKAVILDLG